jgi:hypothetical protein
MSKLAAISIIAVCAAGLSSLAAGAASTSKLPDIPQSYLLTAAGKLTPLRAGVTYRASEFPLALRLTPRERGWSGAQWKSGSDYFRGGGPPNFGWVHVGHSQAPSSPAPPLGLVTIMTAYARTPSVAATVNVLRTRGRGATYEDTSPVTLAGFSGIQFDGRIVGPKNFDHFGHFFIPFSPPSHAAKYYPDEYPVYGDVFRVIVLNVRGKTIVIYIENVALPAEQFPAFLTKANKMLKSLRFPR